MKALIVSNLFPNAQQPERGIFNRQQFKELAKLCEIRVLAPLPLYPDGIPSEELIDGIKVYHPRFLVIPKIGRSWQGESLYQSLKGAVQKIKNDFDFDVIFGTWAYPDCYAASLVAKDLNKPFVAKVHGTDINVSLDNPQRRSMIKETFERADKIIAVSQALKQKIVNLGIPDNKVELIVNGLNKDLFKKLDKQECCRQLSLDPQKKQVLYIGNLVEIKGVEFLLKAFKGCPENVQLNIVGDGELRGNFEKWTTENKLTHRIFFRGKRPHQEIPTWMNASDVFCLPSLNEGCPNVVLEALACGLPVVASKVGGIPDLVHPPQQGMLVEPGNPNALAQALNQVLTSQSRELMGFEPLSWEENAQKVFNILKGVAHV